jgi:structural maintenance of chromosome 3 (chondroitin sulfate proteoglycan 6)
LCLECGHILSTLQEKSLDNIRNQIEQIQSGITMKNDEMGTELIDQLTLEERDLLSRLNPEITGLKEKFLSCKNSRIEVVSKSCNHARLSLDAINSSN